MWKYPPCGLPLIGNVLKPLAESILVTLGQTAAVSATDTAIHKKIFGSGRIAEVSDRAQPSDLASRTTLIITNEEMNDIVKIVTSREGSGLLMKGVSQTIKNYAKEQTGGFLRMLLGT